jgi:hypothetical protein
MAWLGVDRRARVEKYNDRYPPQTTLTYHILANLHRIICRVILLCLLGANIALADFSLAVETANGLKAGSRL